MKLNFYQAWLVLVLAFTMPLMSNGQSYNTIGGVRFGDDIGISFGQRISNHNTIQLLHEIGLNQSGTGTNAYFINHMPLISRRFNFFAGIGGHIKNDNTNGEYLKETIGYGPSATFGLDFTIGRINIAADWSPNLNLNSTADNRFNASTGIALRYVIVKRKTKFKSWRAKMKDKYFTRKKKKK